MVNSGNIKFLLYFTGSATKGENMETKKESKMAVLFYMLLPKSLGLVIRNVRIHKISLIGLLSNCPKIMKQLNYQPPLFFGVSLML